MAQKQLHNSFNSVPSDEEIEIFVFGAATGDNTIVAEFAGKYAAYIDIDDKDGMVALAAAAKEGHKETVELLLNLGADIETRTDRTQDDNVKGRTALLWAVDCEKTEVTTLLLEKGANINALDNDGWTALMYVADKGNKDLVTLLLEKGAHVLPSGENSKIGRSAMQWAVDNNREKLTEMLEKDQSISGTSQMTSLMLARAAGHVEVVDLLEERAELEVNARIAEQQERLKKMSRTMKMMPKR